MSKSKSDEPEVDTEEEYDWDNLEPEEASRILKGIETIIPDILKKTVVAGVGNILMSEEALRSVVPDKKLPKEAVGFLLNQGDNMRKEILRIISREIRVFLENMDFGGEIAKILTTLSFEIRTEVRFVPNDERVVPQVRNRVKVKRQGDDSEESEVVEREEKKPILSRWRRRGASDEEE